LPRCVRELVCLPAITATQEVVGFDLVGIFDNDEFSRNYYNGVGNY